MGNDGQGGEIRLKGEKKPTWKASLSVQHSHTLPHE